MKVVRCRCPPRDNAGHHLACILGLPGGRGMVLRLLPSRFFFFIVASVFLHFDISLSHYGISFSKIAIDLSQKLVFLLLYSFFPSKQRHRFAQVGKLLINKQNFHTFRLRQSKNRAQSGAFVRLIKLDKVGARTGLQIIKPV